MFLWSAISARHNRDVQSGLDTAPRKFGQAKAVREVVAMSVTSAVPTTGRRLGGALEYVLLLAAAGLAWGVAFLFAAGSGEAPTAVQPTASAGRSVAARATPPPAPTPASTVPRCTDAAPVGTCRTETAVLTLADAPSSLRLPSLQARLTGAPAVLAPTTDEARLRAELRVTSTSDRRPLSLGAPDREIYLRVGGQRIEAEPLAASSLAPGATRLLQLRFPLTVAQQEDLTGAGGGELGLRITNGAASEPDRIGVIRFRLAE
jgi:hypothetical protein